MSTPPPADVSATASPGTLVTGDYILDQHIYEGERHHYADQSQGVRVSIEPGGAAKLAELLDLLFNNPASPAASVAPEFLPVAAERANPRFETETSQAYRAYAFWRPIPADAPREKQFWRCTEAMGFGGRELPQLQGADAPPCQTWSPAAPPDSHPAMIVVSDGGMGFRNSPLCWQNLPWSAARHIVLKTCGPLDCQRDLLKLLTEQHSDRLTIIVAASELRKSSAYIPAGLTWEQTFQGFLQELQDPATLAHLTRCRHLVVPFDSEAAVHVRLQTPGSLEGAVVTFVYHASRIEEDARYETEGRAFGYLTCFSAAVTLGLAAGAEERLAPFIAAGIAAMQNLLAEGHGSALEPPSGFPTERIAGVIRNPQEHFTYATLPARDLLAGSWSFLRFAEPTAVSTRQPAHVLARLTALHGPVALANLPHLRIGDLFTVDGDEVTALRNLRQVLRRYRTASEPGSKPLSVGVFGPPGAGKSFSVREIARSLLGARADWLEFNLSQFDGPRDLIGAFHQIRDRVLQGKLPVAFFDEFDSQQYLWLQYLLAPMQDGRFQEGESTHTLGRSILIFAGGTSWTFQTFGPPEPAPGERDPQLRSAYDYFRLRKGPDFKSRLDTYLNVVGPNPRVEEVPDAAPGGPTAPDAAASFLVGGYQLREVDDDVWWPVRRALMLRHQLKLPPDQKLDVDPGLLTALLQTPRYQHGSRSMEKILQAVRGGGALRPSFVPHADQLQIHVQACDFADLIRRRPGSTAEVRRFSDAEVQAIAALIHGNYEQQARRRDPSWKVTTLEQKLAQCRNQGEVDKVESNAAAARRIPDILALIGLTVDRGAAAPEEERDVRTQLELHLELLAAEEHCQWMDWLLRRGWSYHQKSAAELLRHNCLKPYSRLSEADKDKDRSSVRNFPDLLREAGYKIVPL